MNREVTDLLKCPYCHRKGTMGLTIRKKTAYATCRACDGIVSSRVPYPKNRVDEDGYQLHFEIPSTRAISTDGGFPLGDVRGTEDGGSP